MALDWLVENLRVSLFFSEAVKISEADWKRLTDSDEPETEQKAAGRHAMSGPFLGGSLNLVAGPKRLDCILAPSPMPGEQVPEGYVPHIGLWTELWEAFFTSTEGWVEAAPGPVTRLAFGSILLGPVGERDAAYKAMLGYLNSVEGNPDRMRDFLFRVNWPVESKVIDKLTINRLTTWAVVNFKMQVIAHAGEQMLVEERTTPHFVRLEIDHNTDPGHIEPFDPGRMKSLYRELVDLAVANSAKGEIT